MLLSMAAVMNSEYEMSPDPSVSIFSNSSSMVPASMNSCVCCTRALYANSSREIEPFLSESICMKSLPICLAS